MLHKMQNFWNRVMRWITNPFYATNIPVWSFEAGLAPMALHTEHIRLMAAARIVTAILKEMSPRPSFYKVSRLTGTSG